MDFLTEKAVFNCSAGAVIQCKDGGNASVQFNGDALLTTGATVKSNTGICAILTAEAQGTPQPCKCQLNAWRNFALNKTSNGKPLLLQTSTNICAYGGLIKATFSGALSRVTNGS